ncbi:MAG: PASTA domain-containing protein [Ornithinibacter sp.]
MWCSERFRAVAWRGGAVLVATACVSTLALLGPVVVPGEYGVARAAVAPPKRTEPPEVLGLTLPQAREVLKDTWYPASVGAYELIVTPTPDLPQQVSEDAARVVSQVVDRYLEGSKEAAPSAAVTLGVQSVVPDLVGRTREEADGLLGAVGLILAAEGDGLVVRQVPAAGDLLDFGSRVQVVLQPPPTDGARKVPSLVGRTEAEARAAVQGVDLVLEVGSRTGDGELRVSEQQPAPGAERPVGGSVTVTLEGAVVVGTVEVPDVTGLDPDAVRRVLEVAALLLVVDTGGAQGEGLSFRQDPLPGARVDPGTPVMVAFAVVDDGILTSWGPAAGGGLAALAVLGLGLWSVRRSRPSASHHSDGSPGGPPLRLEPTADPSPRVSVGTLHPAADLVIRVVTAPDLGELILTEDSR